MNEKETRALVREEIREAFKSMATDAGFYSGGAYEVTVGAASVVQDVAETVVRSLTPPEPEPVNPFAPKRSAEQWADRIRELIRQADADGAELWVDVEYYGGPGPKIRIGPPDSTGSDDPIVWGEK